MDRSLKEEIWKRAGSRCEYCGIPKDVSPWTFEIDHIIAEKHRGKTISSNLALACFPCNSYKGANVSSVDPDTGQITRLFHPRIDHWMEHFQWDGPLLIGISDIGRATVEVLEFNLPYRVEFRDALIANNEFPC